MTVTVKSMENFYAAASYQLYHKRQRKTKNEKTIHVCKNYEFCLIYNEIVPCDADTGAVLIGKVCKECGSMHNTSCSKIILYAANGQLVRSKHNFDSSEDYSKYPIYFSQKVLNTYTEEELENIKERILTAFH